MKLTTINESGSKVTMYKGLSEFGGIEHWPIHKLGESGLYVPGFVSTSKLARTYAEPELTGSRSTMIISCVVDINRVEDRTEEFKKWCETNNRHCDVSAGFPSEWREDRSLWTVNMDIGAHGNDTFVYVGVPVRCTVIAFYNNQAEWEADG